MTELRADCASCAGLCCVAPAFAASAEFALDKPARKPCPNLLEDFRCGIHDRLRASGFSGCATFDCFGAGQQVTQVTFGGRTWRDEPEIAESMFAAFGVMRHVQEVRWYLAEALQRVPAGALRDQLARAEARCARLSRADADELAGWDVDGHRAEVGELLASASEHVRAEFPDAADHARADLINAGFRGAQLRGARLRGALLLGADLREADLHCADLLGADLRAADLRGARLAGSLFLTQPQVEAARGDGATTLPEGLDRPEHWA